MIDYRLLIPILASFFISLFLLPAWIKKATKIGLTWEDMNKIKKKKIAGSGGIVVVLSFIIGVLIFIAYKTFVIKNSDFLVEILAMLTSIFFLAGIGLVDDLLGWQSGGLRKRYRIILSALAAVPLMVINAGKSIVTLPIVGVTDLGILYPLMIIPIGIVGAATTFNFLAGYNGLEAGLGIFLLSGISLVAFITGNSWLSVIGLCMVLSLLSFLIFNFYPAKIFPGDSLTYAVGGLVAVMAIVGDFERIAIFFFIPFIIETILKLRGKLREQSFALPQKDGSLELINNKIYSLNHLAIYILKKINIKTTEKNIVYLVWMFQIVIILVGLIILIK